MKTAPLLRWEMQFLTLMAMQQDARLRKELYIEFQPRASSNVRRIACAIVRGDESDPTAKVFLHRARVRREVRKLEGSSIS